MGEHPIESVMDTTMENIKSMVDVNTIVGDPVETVEGSVIIPVSKVSFGFAAGGSEYVTSKGKENKKDKDGNEFGGGTGAGVMLQPIAFLVVGQDQVRLMSVDDNNGIEKLINAAPELMKELKSITEDDSKFQSN
ncbi:GerW family sporulation protein [Acetohalobium arabaticum]|uniref:Sporulation protein YtfJ n=1 Tax=Acetohalobium arabaticum (strain ATCC 49924 / DSM 5501 / Z-7288) TaxID=574087 RepID=D9QRP2_ACEAZ|nr:GerW family sporulation protein [Acetohalobium arabaticum]ADL13183.1 sporulation protein YtfJ [Acetohalobium arabaticum DSM 5501]